MSLTQTYGQTKVHILFEGFKEYVELYKQSGTAVKISCSGYFPFFTLFHVNASVAFTLLTLSTTPNLFIKTYIVTNKHHIR